MTSVLTEGVCFLPLVSEYDPVSAASAVALGPPTPSVAPGSSPYPPVGVRIAGFVNI